MKRRLFVVVFCFLSCCVVGFSWWIASNSHGIMLPQPMRAMGRLHPVLLHAPIGIWILILGHVCSVWILKRSGFLNLGIVLFIASACSWLTAVAGLLLYWGDAFQQNELATRHLYGGICFAIGTTVCAFMHAQLQVRHYGFKLSFWITSMVMMVTSHDGASLTHGSKYLTEYLTFNLSPRQPLTKQESKLVYDTLLQPIFNRTCVACHGADKVKAGLRLDSFSFLNQGGTDGAVIIPNQSQESPLVQSMLLPEDDEGHMPPEGKPQPTQKEIELIIWWINMGASYDITMQSLPNHLKP